MVLKERNVDFFHKGTSVYVSFGQRDKQDLTGQFKKFWDGTLRIGTIKKSVPQVSRLKSYLSEPS
jgi:hypothetical protein